MSDETQSKDFPISNSSQNQTSSNSSPGYITDINDDFTKVESSKDIKVHKIEQSYCQEISNQTDKNLRSGKKENIINKVLETNSTDISLNKLKILPQISFKNAHESTSEYTIKSIIDLNIEVQSKVTDSVINESSPKETKPKINGELQDTESHLPSNYLNEQVDIQQNSVNASTSPKCDNSKSSVHTQFENEKSNLTKFDHSSVDNNLKSERDEEFPMDVTKFESLSSEVSSIKQEFDNEENDMLYCISEIFDWSTYLEDTESDGVPPTAFLHVEISLDTGICVGQHVEVLQSVKIDEKDSWSSYWLAKIISSCGNLLRLRYLNDDKNVPSTSLEFWCDISKQTIKPLKWSASKGLPLIPPTLPNKIELRFTGSLDGVESVPEDVLNGQNLELYSKIQEGTLVEVFNQVDPNTCIVAEVKKNVGGRLLLRELSASSDNEKSLNEPFWLFFLDRRIKPLGWTTEHKSLYRYKNKEAEKLSYNASEKCLPKLDKFIDPPKSHRLRKGMILEAIHPLKKDAIYKARISDILDDVYFKISIGNYSWTSNLSDQYILPWGFCESHRLHLGSENLDNFQDDDTEMMRVSGFLLSQDVPALDLGFDQRQKLEFCLPNDSSRIVIATIEKICGHVLVLSDDANPSTIFYQSCHSMDIFPAEWSHSNSYPLHVPVNCKQLKTIKEEQTLTTTLSQASTIKEEVDEDRGSKTNGSNTSWCPKLFINHNCYPGPFLSKNKVAKMYQSVGPGPIKLVLEDVIGMTINSAYIPTRVLRELQNISAENSSWHPMPMKAKFKRHTLKANVWTPSSAGEIDEFFKGVSRVLSCCPNLWSCELFRDSCPLGCAKQGGVGSQNSKKKRGMKRKTYSIKMNPADSLYAELCDQFDPDDNELQLSESDGDSRPASPNFLSSDAARKLKQKRLLSSLVITMNSCRPERDKEPAAKPSSFQDHPTDSNNSVFSSKHSDDGLDSNEGAIFGLEPAVVHSDPLYWSIHDVHRYVENQPAISHHATRLKREEIDGKALLLLNLPSLIHHLQLPHNAAVVLAQHICKVKLAHFLYFYPKTMS